MNSLHTTTKSNPHSPQLERAQAQQQRPNASKNKEGKKFTKKKKTKKDQMGTFLVVLQLRFHLPVQGVRVWSLVVELRSHMSHKQETET